MLLNLRKGSIGDEFDRFFEVLHDQPLADGVSPSAFCQADLPAAERISVSKVLEKCLTGVNNVGM